ncbi:hypothetical protein [Streptomyces sp. WM6372]|uniref:hypothetical protein n=1 Tax=Streptomyces sp. WM6372 TaxID=1415555 RepID=UPI000B0FA85D|nr:hypothetical protein [Streptomyces sp. WM6372]
MHKPAVAGCLLIGLAVIGFLTAADVMNTVSAIAVGVALFIAAGVELKRKKPNR